MKNVKDTLIKFSISITKEQDRFLIENSKYSSKAAKIREIIDEYIVNKQNLNNKK